MAEPEAVTYDALTLVRDIKDTLCKRGSLTIRGLARTFKIMDANKNRQVDLSELDSGLRIIGINLNEEQLKVLLKHFDKNCNGTVDFNEFLVCIRGDLNDARLCWIR